MSIILRSQLLSYDEDGGACLLSSTVSEKCREGFEIFLCSLIKVCVKSETLSKMIGHCDRIRPLIVF